MEKINFVKDISYTLALEKSKENPGIIYFTNDGKIILDSIIYSNKQYNIIEDLTSTKLELNQNTITDIGSINKDISINTKVSEDKLQEYCLIFKTGNKLFNINFDEKIKFNIPLALKVNHRYEINILNNYAVWAEWKL